MDENPYLRKILRMNKVLLGLTVFLALLGVAAIYSATFMREGKWAHLKPLWIKQTVWVILGLTIFFAVSLTDYRWIKNYFGGVIIYTLGLLLLVLVEVFGQVKSGAQSWLSLGPIDLQPSQVAILGGILLLGVVLSETRNEQRITPDWLRIFFAGAVVGGPFLLILLQPDLGSALVWIPVLMTMLFVAGIQKRWLTLLIILGCGICAPLAIAFVLKDYQLERLLVFRDPESDPLDSGYAIIQSMTAIGSAGVQGRGWLSDTNLNYNGFIPINTAHNDYLFTVIAEQVGLPQTLVLVMIFTALVVWVLYVALNAHDLLGSLIASGVAALLFTHIFLNTGMTVSFVPITGLPLPLVSYGGTFALLILFSLGLVQSIWIHRDSEDA